MSRIRFILLLAVFGFVLGVGVLYQPVNAQGFGSNPDNYTCPTYDGVEGTLNERTFKCEYVRDGFIINTKSPILKPPRLQVLQIWFVRILYVIWGVSGVAFTGILISIGAQYMFSFSNEVALADVIKRFQKWVIGLALVFLSYPLLATFFGILPLSSSSCFNSIQMPGFQFFFPGACLSCIEACEYEFSLDGSSPEIPEIDMELRRCIENCND